MNDGPDIELTTGSLFLSGKVVIQPPTPPTIHICGNNGQPLVSIHPDGRTEFGDGYQPDTAAQAFWSAVQHLAPVAVETRAQKQVEALTEAVILWRDRPGGDIGLAIALAGILDTEAPEPPAATALVRVLKECDRIERAVKGSPTNADFDGAYLACLRHIREAAGVVPPDPESSL